MPLDVSFLAMDDKDPLTFANVEAAIAAFEQTLITPNAPFDRFLRGDDAANFIFDLGNGDAGRQADVGARLRFVGDQVA